MSSQALSSRNSSPAADLAGGSRDDGPHTKMYSPFVLLSDEALNDPMTGPLAAQSLSDYKFRLRKAWEEELFPILQTTNFARSLLKKEDWYFGEVLSYVVFEHELASALPADEDDEDEGDEDEGGYDDEDGVEDEDEHEDNENVEDKYKEDVRGLGCREMRRLATHWPGLSENYERTYHTIKDWTAVEPLIPLHLLEKLPDVVDALKVALDRVEQTTQSSFRETFGNCDIAAAKAAFQVGSDKLEIALKEIEKACSSIEEQSEAHCKEFTRNFADTIVQSIVMIESFLQATESWNGEAHSGTVSRADSIDAQLKNHVTIPPGTSERVIEGLEDVVLTATRDSSREAAESQPSSLIKRDDSDIGDVERRVSPRGV